MLCIKHENQLNILEILPQSCVRNNRLARVSAQGYREPAVVRHHDQLSYIGPERAYTGPALNLPVPVNMFIPPMAQPFNGQPPVHISKSMLAMADVD